MSVLEPLATRYAYWLGLPAEDIPLMRSQREKVLRAGDTSDEDPAEVRAMPVILRMERAEPPGRTALLEAAAAAAVAVCLDERAEPEGEWHEPLKAWVDGRIRKVSRRARGAHWQAVQELPGITVTVDGAEARALLPGRVLDTSKEVSRLQISGSELPADEPGPAPEGLPRLLLNPEVSMTVGKGAAQVGHATMILASLLDEAQRAAWAAEGFRCSVRTPPVAVWKSLCPIEDPEGAWRRDGVVAVRDAGFTEVDPGTVTVLAQHA